MADYPQFNYNPGVAPDTGEGLAKGISQIGTAVTGAIEKHDLDLQKDAYNDMIMSQAIQSGEVRPEVLGYKPGDTPSAAELWAKYKGMNRQGQTGAAAGAAAMYADKLTQQAAETRKTVQAGNLMAAQAGAYNAAYGGGGGGGSGGGIVNPLLTPEGKPTGVGTATVPSGKGGVHTVVVKLPGQESPEVLEKDAAGHYFYRGSNGQRIPATLDQITAAQMAERQAQKGAQSAVTPQGAPAPKGAPAASGRITVTGPDPNNPGRTATFTVPAAQADQALAAGYQIVP